MSFNSEFGQTGNYMEFYKAIKLMYPDIQMISNCDGSNAPLDHLADFYDFHVSNFISLSFCMLIF
jgi:alpha-N-arabinofuranosidase